MNEVNMENFDVFFSFFNKLTLNYFTVSFVLFLLGMISLYLNKDNMVKTLMSFELIVLATALNFTMASGIHNDMAGQVAVILTLTVAATESGIGLAIFFSYFKKKKSVAVKDANLMKG